MLALINCWVPRWKIFRIGGSRVPFSIYDVALFTGLPTIRRAVELDGDEVSTNVGQMVRGRILEWEMEEMVSREPGRSGKERRFLRNCVSSIVALCDANNAGDRVVLWVKIYKFMVLSGVMFPCTMCGVAWGVSLYK